MAVTATSVWRVRTGGNNANGGGYDPGIAGAATDYSQQDAAQATGTLGTASGTTTFTDAGGVFTAAMVGNAMWIASGAGFTVGAYFVTGYTSATQITIDRSPGTGTVAVWKIGGAWADPITNVSGTGPLVAGNTVYVRGAGSDSPAAADYSLAARVTPKAGDATNGLVKFIGENGRPCVTVTGDALIYYQCNSVSFENIKLLAGSTTNAAFGMVQTSSTFVSLFNCVFDQNGKDVRCLTDNSGVASFTAVSCEFYNSGSATVGTLSAIATGSYNSLVTGCNLHDCKFDGILCDYQRAEAGSIIGNVIAKNGGNGITVTSRTPSNLRGHIFGNTIDGNAGHGISGDATMLQGYDCFSNFITNHNGASKYGINVSSGTTAANDRIKVLWDFNWYYNNTANFNTVSAGPHDNTAGTDPLYTNQSTQDYSLQSSSPAIGKGFPASATYGVPGASPASLTTISPLVPRRKVSPDVTNYMDAGGVQRIMAAGGGGLLVHPGMAGRVNG